MNVPSLWRDGRRLRLTRLGLKSGLGLGLALGLGSLWRDGQRVHLNRETKLLGQGQGQPGQDRDKRSVTKYKESH